MDVFSQAIGKDGETIGSEQPIEHSGSTAVTSAVFFPEESGVFEITVRIALTDPSITSDDCPNGICSKKAPRPVRVSTLPPVLWVGSLAQNDPAFEGAVFLGIAEEDNTGSSLSPAGDLDGDGLREFVIGSRYGKSLMSSPRNTNSVRRPACSRSQSIGSP